MKLRRCPHCGGRPLVAPAYKVSGPFRKRWFVTCTRCVEASGVHILASMAVRDWNRMAKRR